MGRGVTRRQRLVTFEKLNRLTRAAEIPLPGSCTVLDEQQRTLNLPLFIVGEGAERFLVAVHEQTSGHAERRFLSLISSGQSSWNFLPVRLGEVRGWTPILWLYSITDDPRLIPTLEKHGEHARGFVLAEPNGNHSALLSALRRLLTKKEAPFAVFGPAVLADELSVSTGRQPVAVVEPLARNAMRTLKDVTRPLLESILRDL
jgi:hypothetical protein